VAATPLRALIVDDHPRALAALARLAASLGWQTELADSAAAAVQRLQGAAGAGFDAVFVDGQMPGPGDSVLVRQILHLGLAGAAPVIALVGSAGREALEAASGDLSGAPDAVLVKPLTASMLQDAVLEARHADARALALPAADSDAVRRLPGLRLLLVEDNANNQQVARELLEDEGASVLIAHDGQQAVDILARDGAAFDLVLMDLQMPVMDGFTATRHIRQLPGLAGLPIVAMTANAMESDRSACLAAGMNAHVGKPFDLDPLVALLRRLARWTELDAPPARSGDAALPADLHVAAAAAGVELGQALARLGGRDDVYRRMLQHLVNDLDTLPALLQSQLAKGDMAALARQLHTLRGVAATLGAVPLAAAAGQAETQLAAAAVGPALAQATRVIVSSRRSLDALLQAWPTPAPSPTAGAELDPAALRTALVRLGGLLQNADMAAMEVMTDLHANYGAALGDRLQALEASVHGLDFDRGLSQCRALMEEFAA
jgi:CheY-like chemotaxis protein/HPt (histidine-containing phosphotransfer) domain-containing protein